MFRAAFLIILALSLAACATPPSPAGPGMRQSEPPAALRARAKQAAQRFIAVVDAVEPVAERECRRRAPQANCDYLIVVDDRPGQPPNAFQTVDSRGRPVVAFTLGLIAQAQNTHELAFVMGHEAAHHIQGHLNQAEQNARAGATILGGMAQAAGGDAALVEIARTIGAAVGARSFSKEHELEADALGALIAARAGFDPTVGIEFFTRIPDPGDKFLGTHPPNAERIAAVRQVIAGL